MYVEPLKSRQIVWCVWYGDRRPNDASDAMATTAWIITRAPLGGMFHARRLGAVPGRHVFSNKLTAIFFGGEVRRVPPATNSGAWIAHSKKATCWTLKD